MTYMDHLVLLV